ncbi:hypothetical protein V6C03_11255 [Methyloligella sp. 2.7D]|uniref:hypothetical protein n=1 Tax=unclassified Methyloligella TaxID=2625955 RepID=UPI00157CCBAD|nr:hypothetical protein [Methyloligella sp. GL2]QKP77605.1 hypothetical protein HT051_09205 [Methyloligella sp. GL2]
MNTRRIALLAFLVSAVALGLAPAAQACEGTQLKFSDDFDDDAGGWALNNAVEIADGNFTFALEPDDMQANLNISHTVEENVDICADAVWPKEENGILGAGILFWGEDSSNFFQFGILNNGKYWIARRQDGRWQVIVQNMKSDAIKVQPGSTNQLRVKASGNHVSFFVNGDELRELRGQPPARGWRFGLSGDNFDKQASEKIVFSSVKVTD